MNHYKLKMKEVLYYSMGRKHGFCFRRLMLFVCCLLLAFIQVSCLDGDDKSAECAYNTRIVYRYNREGSETENMAGWYIRTLDEYIYDASGKLYSKRYLDDGLLIGEYNLPPGQYTLVAWANRTIRNLVSDGNGPSEANTLDSSWLYPDSPAPGDPALLNGGDKLFYGYRTFSVEKDMTSFINVDMEHTYCELSLTARWMNGSANKAGIRSTNSYYMLLEGAPSRLSFLPDWEINGGTHPYDRNMAAYPISYLNGSLSYLPHVNGLNEPVTHRKDSELTSDGSLFCRFIIYRLTTRDDEQKLLLSIYDAAGRQVMKRIDLSRFFDETLIDIDVARRQEYSIILEIEGNTVTAFNLQPLDWEDAGQLGWD
jgi:hypothetical protein